VGKQKKARSGKYFCVMLTLQLALAVGLFVYSLVKVVAGNTGFGTFVMEVIVEGAVAVVFLVFTILNFALSFRFRKDGGKPITLLSVLVFVFCLLLIADIVVFAVIPFALFVSFGWLLALASQGRVEFIENLFYNPIGSWIALALTVACTLVLRVMVALAWKKLATLPAVAPVSK